MSVKKIFIILFASLFCQFSWSNNKNEKELVEKIQVIADELAITQEQLFDLEQDSNKYVSISGYADVEYQMSSIKEKYSTFRMHHLSLFFEKELSNRWRFFSELEFEDAPIFEGKGDPQTGNASGTIVEEAEGEIRVESINLNYQWRPKLNFRLGRFFTPAGIWSIKHKPPFVPTQERPIHIYKIFPQLVDGAMIYGALGVNNNILNYDLYIGNGEGNTGKQDKNEEKALGLKLALYLPILTYFEIGGTVYTDTFNDKTTKKVTGSHVSIKANKLSFQAEIAQGTLKPIGAVSYETKGYYAQLFYDTGQWTFGFRYDYYNPDSSLPNADITVNSVFVNYHVSSTIVLKAEHHASDYQDPAKEDSTTTILSAVVYLGN